VHGLTSMVVSGHAAVTAPGITDAGLLAGVCASTEAWLAPSPAGGTPR
jgi:hypothetical protein